MAMQMKQPMVIRQSIGFVGSLVDNDGTTCHCVFTVLGIKSKHTTPVCTYLYVYTYLYVCEVGTPIAKKKKNMHL